MRTRAVKGTLNLLGLYARSAVAMVPGASRLPFVPGGGGELPGLELALDGVRVHPEKVAAYAEVCGDFSRGEVVPVAYPHVLAFPLHMAVMADGRFPFAPVGLIHTENRIVQRRPIGLDEQLALRVRPTALEAHPHGSSFALLTEVLVDGEPVWEGLSRMLHRGGGEASATRARGAVEDDGGLERGEEWHLGGDAGRRYAAVSGDRNPIHMHSLSARAFGFPGSIAHGMWTKARCLAELESRLPDAFSVQVSFRKPIVLPGSVWFLSAAEDRGIRFSVRGAAPHALHLDGRVMPLDAGAGAGVSASASAGSAER